MPMAQFRQALLIAFILCHMVSPAISISAHRIRVAHFAKSKKFIPGGAGSVMGMAAKAVDDHYLTDKKETKKPPAVAGGPPSTASCGMCLYLMETLDHNVGVEQSGSEGGDFAPSHAVHWPQNLPPTLNMPGFASPLGNQPLTHDAIAGPGFALLETSSHLRGARPRHGHRPRASATQHTNQQSSTGPVFLQTGSKQGDKFVDMNGQIDAGKRAIGLMTCRPGTKFCRPRLLQMGARAAQRRLRMQAESREQLGMQAAMIEELNEHCTTHLPKSYQGFCSTVSSKIMVVAGEMIHDYSDDEICSDIGMCNHLELGMPGEPGAGS